MCYLQIIELIPVSSNQDHGLQKNMNCLYDLNMIFKYVLLISVLKVFTYINLKLVLNLLKNVL